MIKDKGKPVFEENTDDILAEKIIKHSKRNSKNHSPAENTLYKEKKCCASLHKPVWKYIAASIASLFSITLIVLLIKFLFNKDND